MANFMRMNEYKLIEKIGKGTHGTVYLLKSNENLVVCKSVTNKYKSHAYREINILRKISHRRIVSMVDNLVIKNSIYIILEYINYGSVEGMIEFFRKGGTQPSSSLGWGLLAQMADVLYYLHSRRIIHRDIKPANILVSRFSVGRREYMEFKLCDFSLSVQAERVEDGHVVGTPFYMAPEVVGRGSYGATVDVWGLGCTVYELMNLAKPFEGQNRGELFDAILRGVARRGAWEDEGLGAMVGRCLAREERINSKAIARSERVRLHLAMLELRIKEKRIEELERELFMMRE